MVLSYLLIITLWNFQIKDCEVKLMERITKERVKHIAHLSRLELSEDEVEKFAKQIF